MYVAQQVEKPSGKLEVDEETFVRFRLHLRRLLREHHPKDGVYGMAARLGCTHGYIYRILSGERDPGLGMVLAVHRGYNESMNYLMDTDPPPDKRDAIAAAETVSPYPASPSPARPGKQKKSGGR